MKLLKLCPVLMLLVSGVTLNSCSDDENTPEPTKKITLYGTFVDDAKSMAESRMTLDKVTKNFLWQENDVITVWDQTGNNTKTFKLKSGAGTNDGVFECEMTEAEAASFIPTNVLFSGRWSINNEIRLDVYDVENFNDGATLGNVFATSKVTQSGTGANARYSFKLEHSLGYAVFNITNSADASWTDKTLSVSGHLLIGEIKNILSTADGLSFVWNTNNKSKTLNIKSDGTQILAVPPGGEIESITANGKLLWSGNRVISAGTIVNFKKDF